MSGYDDPDDDAFDDIYSSGGGDYSSSYWGSDGGSASGGGGGYDYVDDGTDAAGQDFEAAGGSGGGISSGFDTEAALNSHPEATPMSSGEYIPEIDLSNLVGLTPEALEAANVVPDKQYVSGRARSIGELTTNNIGSLYLAVGLAGCGYGVVTGIRGAKSWKPRFVVNSVLNAVSRSGAHFANNAGAAAFLYSGFVFGLDWMEFDKVPAALGLRRRDIYTHMAAAGMTGFVWRAFAPRRQPFALRIASATMAGGIAAAGIGIAGAVGEQVLGKLSPLRWNN